MSAAETIDVDKENTVILAVDDNVELLSLICEELEDEGYQVLRATCGNEAFEIVQKNHVDLILSDVRMPNGDGVHLIQQVKTLENKNPVVIFLTAFANITFEELYNQGAEAVFSKPPEINKLLDCIEEALIPKEIRWRRQFSRAKCNYKMILTSKEEQVDVIDIGRGGFFAKMATNFPGVGDIIDFKIEVNHQEVDQLEGSGIVRWVRPRATGEFPAGVGVEFMSLDEKTCGKVLTLFNILKTKAFIPRG